MKFIDTHVHSYFEGFDADRSQVIAADRAAGATHHIQIGCDETSSMAAIALAQQFEGNYATVGLHPCDVETALVRPRLYPAVTDYIPKAKTYEQLWHAFDHMISTHRDHVVGIGETGFDRYHADSEQLVQIQHDCFLAQLKLCLKYDLPVVIHSRNADDTLLQFMREHMPRGRYRGVVHCFCGDAALAHEITQNHELHLGLGGVFTYGGAQGVREAIAGIDTKWLLTETDAPFLVPQAYRKAHKRCESNMIPSVIKRIAEVKNMPMEDCTQQLHHNAKNLFSLA